MASDAIIADIQTIIDRIHQQHTEHLSADDAEPFLAPLSRTPSPQRLAVLNGRGGGDEEDAPADTIASATAENAFDSEVEDTAACRRRLAALLATATTSTSTAAPRRHQRMQRHVERDGDDDGYGGEGDMDGQLDLQELYDEKQRELDAILRQVWG